jgi:nucleoside-diphosphate-sugar epimerase
MFALRREADAAIDQMGGLEVIHVLNGAFMDMLLDPRTAGVVDLEAGTGNYYGDGSDEFDITLIDDVAAFTAHIALDESAEAGIYPISGARTSFDEIIAEVERVTRQTLTRKHRGSIDDLHKTVTEAPNPWTVIGQWYNYSMLTTPPFGETQNERYADARPTSLHDYLVRTIGRDNDGH